jgi:hypothetical protein
MPFIYKYQVDGAGDYVLDQGNKVILESYEYGEGAGLDWRRIASSTKKPPYVRSFQVRKFDNGDTWVLIINQKQLVGIYPSQDAALQILNGLFTRVSANDEAARATMSYQLSKGYSSVDPAFNNLTLARSGDDLVITLSLINTTDPAIATPIVTWDDYTNPGSPGQKTTVGSVTEPEGGTQVFTIVGGWNTAVENNYIQAFLEDSGVGVSASSNVILKDEVDPSGTLSVLIQNLAGDGPPEATTDGNTYTGAAYATPSWTVEDWPVGVTPSYSYAWAYEVDGGGLVSVGGSGSTLDLALVPYGATITVGAVATAYVNGKIVTSASPAPQVAVAVSGPVGIDVVDIRLFTDAGRTDNVTDNPPGDTLLYAYAYGDVNAPDSTPITNATYFEGQGVVASFTGTPAPSEFDAEDGTVLSVTDAGVAGTDTPTVTYAWSTGATTPTLDTTGLEGTAITCTVTASNQWTPDATAVVDFGTITAVPEDWDTNADGIWGTPSATNDPADSQELTASVNYLTTASGGFNGWYRDLFDPASRYWNTLGGDTPPPYIAVWNETTGVWHGWSGHGTLSPSGNETIRWDAAGADLWTFAHEGDVLVIVYLSQEPTNFANWRDYDGPLPGPAVLQTVTVTCDVGGANATFSDLPGDTPVMADTWPGLVNGNYLTWMWGAELENYPALWDGVSSWWANNLADALTYIDLWDLRITRTVAGFPGEDATMDIPATMYRGDPQAAYLRFDVGAIQTVGAASTNGPTTWVVEVYAAGDLP